MSAGEVDWEVFAAHLREQGEEHLLDQYPEYAEYLRSKKAGGEPPPEVPSTVDEGPVRVIERIVERQVLVIRCKFCRELSPVELEKCKSCGEAEFY